MSDEQKPTVPMPKKGFGKRGKVPRVMAIIREMAPMEVLRTQENIMTWKKEIIRQLGGTP